VALGTAVKSIVLIPAKARGPRKRGMAREGEEDDGHYERGNTKMQGGGRETRANAAEGTAQQAADPDTRRYGRISV
jgi:hypothetical protein